MQKKQSVKNQSFLSELPKLLCLIDGIPEPLQSTELLIDGVPGLFWSAERLIDEVPELFQSAKPLIDGCLSVVKNMKDKERIR